MASVAFLISSTSRSFRSPDLQARLEALTTPSETSGTTVITLLEIYCMRDLSTRKTMPRMSCGNALCGSLTLAAVQRGERRQSLAFLQEERIAHFIQESRLFFLPIHGCSGNHPPTT